MNHTANLNYIYVRYQNPMFFNKKNDRLAFCPRKMLSFPTASLTVGSKRSSKKAPTPGTPLGARKLSSRELIEANSGTSSTRCQMSKGCPLLDGKKTVNCNNHSKSKKRQHKTIYGIYRRWEHQAL